MVRPVVAWRSIESFKRMPPDNFKRTSRIILAIEVALYCFIVMAIILMLYM
ncbi:MAG: hypothetical protein HC859_16465 [Bacteroidia bacterium]|nr:hypothetical protein [Bacteroidia bacterium]